MKTQLLAIAALIALPALATAHPMPPEHNRPAPEHHAQHHTGHTGRQHAAPGHGAPAQHHVPQRPQPKPAPAPTVAEVQPQSPERGDCHLLIGQDYLCQ